MGRPESEATAELPAARPEHNHTNGGGETAGQELPNSLRKDGSSTPVLESSESKHPPAGEPRQTIQKNPAGGRGEPHTTGESTESDSVCGTISDVARDRDRRDPDLWFKLLTGVTAFIPTRRRAPVPEPLLEKHAECLPITVGVGGSAVLSFGVPAPRSHRRVFP